MDKIFIQQAVSLLIVWCVFYITIIRPGRMAEKSRRASVMRMKKGAFIITTHGMRAVVKDFDEKRKYIEVEIADGVYCSLDEKGVAQVLSEDAVEDKVESSVEGTLEDKVEVRQIESAVT